MDEGWILPGATKDTQSITSDWQAIVGPRIDGVRVRSVANVVGSDRVLTEIWRRDWEIGPFAVEQVFQVVMRPGSVSAWHAHAVTTDRLFAAVGTIRVVLFDARPESSSYQQVDQFLLSDRRPQLVSVPPCVWHGVQNVTAGDSILLNAVDQAYAYEDPDHWRLPPDTDQIPHRFE